MIWLIAAGAFVVGVIVGIVLMLVVTGSLVERAIGSFFGW